MSSRRARYKRYGETDTVKESPLAGWVQDHVGEGKPYRSFRDWALAAGLNENTLYLLVNRGRGDPATLVKLAEAVGESPKPAFRAAGWLKGAEAEDELPDWQKRLLAGANRLPEPFRRALDVELQGLLKLAQELGAVVAAEPDTTGPAAPEH